MNEFWSLNMNPNLAYLLGLICGRGKTYESGRVVIEFAHTIEFISGLALCPKCESASAKSRKDGKIHCKNSLCKAIGFTPIEKFYNQRQETRDSIENIILPFLKKVLKFDSSLISNSSITLLILDFDHKGEDWQIISKILEGDFDYHYGRVPKQIFTENKSNQVEFINGILDSAGFCNKGNQQGNRKTAAGNEALRQRVYIQIVRNWHIVIDIDEILRNSLGIPVQTIRWAHPNLDDGKLKSINEGKTSQQREHQIKLHPEFMEPLKFRISHKQAIFEELKNFNQIAGFAVENWIESNKIIRKSQMTPNHPLEVNPRFPIEVRQHFDASWQVALALKCKDLQALAAKAKNPQIFSLNGDLLDSRNLIEVEREIQNERNELNKKFPFLPTALAGKRTTHSKKSKKTITEMDTYPLLENFFDGLYFNYDDKKGKFFEIATLTLSSYAVSKPEVFSRIIDEIEDYKIHVDLIGYDKLKDSIIIVESKVEPLTIEMVGQLLGYCLVAQPSNAYLVSTYDMTPALLNSVSANSNLLDYGNGGKIRIGKLDATSGTVKLI